MTRRRVILQNQERVLFPSLSRISSRIGFKATNHTESPPSQDSYRLKGTSSYPCLEDQKAKHLVPQAEDTQTPPLPNDSRNSHEFRQAIDPMKVRSKSSEPDMRQYVIGIADNVGATSTARLQEKAIPSRRCPSSMLCVRVNRCLKYPAYPATFQEP